MNSKTEVFMLDSGRQVKDMGVENKYGRMAQSMRVTGKIMWLQERGASYTLMEIYMKVSGRLTKHMDMYDI